MRSLASSLILMLLAVADGGAFAQLSYTGGTITQDFDSLPASGTFTAGANGPASLASAPFNLAAMSGWAITGGGTVSAKLRADTGVTSTGSHSSYGAAASPERALGVIASGSYVGRTGFSLVNNTGGPLTQLTIAFTGEQWRNGGSGVANTLSFSWSLNATDIATGSFTSVTALDFTSLVTSTTAVELDGNAPANRAARAATISGIPWGAGQTLTIRWSDRDDAGTDDALAIDDITFSAVQSPLPVITRIHAVQDDLVTSPMAGATVTLEGVVVGDYQGASPALGGFYLQELPANMDADPATSEGIFVDDYLAPGEIAVSPGDVVQVTGTVAEVSGVTTIINPSFVVKSGSAPVPAPVAIALPAATLSGLERYEGMLVQISQTLSVTGNDRLGTDGELTLSVNGVVETPTESIDPNDVPASGTSSTTTAGNTNVAALTAQQSLNRRRSIVLNDASRRGNPNPTPLLSAQQTRRCGDTLAGVTGFLSYASGVNRIEPAAPVVFTDVNSRPISPPAVGGRLKVASMNCLNYFLTLGSRGAASAAELQRQQDKLVAQIIGLDADVVGLIEVENIGAVAVDALVAAVNAALGASVYARVPEPSATGVDVTRVAMVYRPSTVAPGPASFTDTDPVWNRPPLAVLFTEVSTDAKFIACVNHFKSKTSTNATGLDVDQGDGQGAYNDRRKQQAARLITFLSSVSAAAGSSQVLVLGDLNAYSQEDPVDTLRAGGYADQLATYSPGGYSYVFEGARGHLDHALATAALASQITGAGCWHINADEPSVLDYTLAGKSAAQQEINAGTPFRASDHDPVLVGLTLTPPSVTYASWAAGIAWPPGSDSSPAGDADRDGASNLEELMSGMNPLAADAQLRAAAQVAAGVLHFDYRLRHTVAGQIVVPQWSLDLAGWTDLVPGIVIGALTPTTDLRRVSLDGSAASRGFVRLSFR